MCGIGSIALLKTAPTSIDLEAGVDALMRSLMSRGRDASGLVAITANGRLSAQKAAVDAYDFAKGRLALPGTTRAVAVHTRFATQGNKGWMRNNHPVECGEAFVCHNGVVADEWLDRKTGEPEVDSFALSFLANKNAKRKEGETISAHAARLISALAQVEGSKCVQVAFKGQAVLISAKIQGNPLFYGATEQGVAITASTVEAVEKAAEAMELTFGTVEQEVEVKKGNQTIKEMQKFKTIYDTDEGTFYAWEGGTVTRGSIELPKEFAFKKPVKVQATNYQRPAQPQQNSGYYSNIDVVNNYSIGAFVTCLNPNNHLHGRKGKVVRVTKSSNPQKDQVEVRFERRENTENPAKTIISPEFTAVFAPEFLMYWTTFEYRKKNEDRAKQEAAAKKQRDESEAKKTERSTPTDRKGGWYALTAGLTKSQKRRFRRDFRDHKLGFAIEEGWIDPRASEEEYAKQVAHVLANESPCDLCSAWEKDYDLEEVEGVWLCEICDGAVKANPTLIKREASNA